MPRDRVVFGGVRDTARFLGLLEAAGHREGLAALLAELGLSPVMEEVAGPGRAAYGLAGEAGAWLEGLFVAGRRGSLVALLLEPAVELSMGHVGELARRVRAAQPVCPTLFVVPSRDRERLTLAMFGRGGLCALRVDRRRPLRSDLDALGEMAGAGGSAGAGAGVEAAVRIARALDRSRLTRRFFRDFRTARSKIAAAWQGVPASASRDRDQLALLLLCRLMFLYFLQRRGLLASDPDYLASRLLRECPEPVQRPGDDDRRTGAPPGAGGAGARVGEASLYRRILVPLFFAALNTRPDRRSAAGAALGEVPYLNGGLFEPHELERRHGPLILPDAVLRGVVRDLLERYRFTTRGAGDAVADGVVEVGVDPEMLGRVFEDLMESDRRGRTGSFYTPAPVVDRVVREVVTHYLAGETGDEAGARALVEGRAAVVPPRVVRERLREVRVLDPACGSGAFLLGALSRLSLVQARLTGEEPERIRRELVGRSLHGVDLLDDAALLCALRLWLALSFDGTGDGIEPLPNLDRRIRQGDALVDPLDLREALGHGSGPEPARDAAVRQALGRLAPAASRYVAADPELRSRLREELSAIELELARAWIDALDRRAAALGAELAARAGARDLFGERPPDASRAARRLAALDRGRRELAGLRSELEARGSVPFFSFGVHFAEADGFDLILSNPPWVRAHRWPAQLRRVAARRYAVTRRAGWTRGTHLAGAPRGVGAQVDLSHLFLERSIRLLAPGGVLGMLVPAKSFRSLYGAGARRLLLQETELLALEDHGLDQNAVFRADAFTGVVVARRERPGRPGGGGLGIVRCTVSHRAAPALRFALDRDDLPLYPDDLDSPWLIAPPAARAAMRAMQAAGSPLGEHGLRIRRGVMTGANDVLLVDEVRPRLGDLAEIRARGSRSGVRQAGAADGYEALIELSALRPVVQGRDIDAYRYGTGCSVIWCHDDSGAPRPPGKRTRRYLDRHEDRLCARAGWRSGMPIGAVFRLAPELVGPKVAWKDLADTLRAVAIPASVQWHGARRLLVPLNTVYFIGGTERQALVLAALLNSMPVRTFCRAVAERAKDARFRFFAWTVALVPLPGGWDAGPLSDRLRALSSAAHDAGGLAPAAERETNRLVGTLYGLDEQALEALDAFERWLGSTP